MKVWAFWQKGVNYFSQSIGAILEYVSVANQMFDAKVLIKRLPFFQCSKNYGNPTRETNFKVVIKVANPNSLMKKRSYP